VQLHLELSEIIFHYELRGTSQCSSLTLSRVRFREKDPEPDENVAAPLNRSELEQFAQVSIDQRERDYQERLHRVSAAVSHK